MSVSAPGQKPAKVESNGKVEVKKENDKVNIINIL